MRLALSKVAETLVLALVLILVLIMDVRAEPAGFDFPKVIPDPNPLQILGPAGERFTFTKTCATTGGRYVMADALIPPGAGPLPHIHHYTDEWFYFPDGGLTLEMGSNIYPNINKVPGVNLPKEQLHLAKADPGSLFYGPKYHVHGFINPGQKPRRLIFVWTPDDGITEYFKEVGQPMPDPSNPPAINPKSKALFISQAPKYGINQSAYFNQYIDAIDHNFPKMDNHVDELLALLAPDVEGAQPKAVEVKNATLNLHRNCQPINLVEEPVSPKVITGKFTAKPERKEELIQLAQSLFEPSRAEPGCASYNFYEDPTSENSFLFLEEWTSQKAIDQHFQTAHFKRFMEKFPDMIVGTPSIKIYEIGEVKEVT
jgi:quinol monooxygenase YgiN/mannose-6-phosphate isomerase-like protein (cupin superfamily)